LTDHGVLFGAIEFYKRAKKAGVKPIIGCEAYIVTKGSRFDKKLDTNRLSKGRRESITISFSWQKMQRIQELSRLCTIGHTEGFTSSRELMPKSSRNTMKESSQHRPARPELSMNSL